MKDDLMGLVLVGVEGRWSDYFKEDFYEWICNF